jgi:hypothetical protein
LELGDFAGSEFAPASGDGRVGTEAVEEEADFSEREVHFTGDADEEDAIEGFARVAALAVEALGRREKAEFFVVADGGSGDAGVGGELADFHCGVDLRLFGGNEKWIRSSG